MKTKHNKKRNTAFVFEALIREATKAIVSKNSDRKNKVVSIIKEHFTGGSILSKELRCYKALLETRELDKYTAEKMIFHVRAEHEKLSQNQIFTEQSKLIKVINQELGSSVFSNFVPNYKNLATVYNIFNDKTSIKEKILLEQKVVDSLTSTSEEDSKDHIDNLTYKTFVESFNKKYAKLPKNQKELLTNYIASFSDNSLGLKVYLNDQVSELKDKMVSFKDKEFFNSEDLKQKHEQVMIKLESYRDREVDDNLVSEVLMIQALVEEIENA